MRTRGGLVFKAHRLVYHSAVGWRVIKNEEERFEVKGLDLGLRFRAPVSDLRLWGVGFGP